MNIKILKFLLISVLVFLSACVGPTTHERFVSIEDTIKEIERKKTAGEVLMPNINESALDGRDPPSATPANRIGF